MEIAIIARIADKNGGLINEYLLSPTT